MTRTDYTTRTASATARRVGSKIVHEVHVTPEAAPVIRATRTSERRYAYAIVRWVTVDGHRTVSVVRWSDSPKAPASKGHFAVRVESV